MSVADNEEAGSVVALAGVEDAIAANQASQFSPIELLTPEETML